MEQFIDLTIFNTLALFFIGLTGGIISGFIGASGAFVLTPAMMSLGIPGLIAVASNMAHKFPKALEGAYKRSKYGQVDLKLGLLMGVLAGIGMITGWYVMMYITQHFGQAGSDLYISITFIAVLTIVGGLVLRDGIFEKRGKGRFDSERETISKNPLARWVNSMRIPGTMITSDSLDNPISFLALAPIGFITGFIAMTIAVGGFIGVPAMMYILGLSAMVASATELVIAAIIGIAGSLLYSLDGLIDIRLSLLLMAGSFIGIQIGSTSATYAQDYVIKLTMATIMLLVLASRLFYIPGYLYELEIIQADGYSTFQTLNTAGANAIILALLVGNVIILYILYRGIRATAVADKMLQSAAEFLMVDDSPLVTNDGIGSQLSPLGRFERLLVASDGSDFSSAAVQAAVLMAKQCGAELHIMSLVPVGLEYEAIGENVLKQELEKCQTHLDEIQAQAKASGVDKCITHLVHGQTVHQEIIALGERLGVDVIVMGQRGRRGLARVMLGHATALVIGKAHCSVLVVPKGAKIQGRHFLVATDGSRFGDAAVITTNRLGLLYEAPVTVVSVTSPKQSEETRANAWQTVGRAAEHMYDNGVQVDTRTLEGQPAKVIVEFAKERNSDLIVTGSHGRTGLDRVLIGSTSEKILNDTPCSVLVVKAT
ncbi:permease [Achromatium sp. WMS2]|nr:permease [Achromatium sp. WMS2]